MHLRRSTRAIIAVVTALLLLACQTAFAAQACAHGFASAESASATPCHDMAGEESTPSQQTGASSDCEAAKAVVEAVKLPAFSVADLPVVALLHYETAVVAQASSRRSTTQAVCSSPPLTLLHCRFLN
jgi:hypothetical protein